MHLRICRPSDYRACSSIQRHTRRRLYVLRYRSPAARLTHLFKDAHVYGVFNFAVGIGAAGKSAGHSWLRQTIYECSSLRHSVGPVLSGEVQLIVFLCAHSLIFLSFPQIFERFSKGWTILNLVMVAIIATAVAVVVFFTGERPLARRLRGARLVLTCKVTDAT